MLVAEDDVGIAFDDDQVPRFGRVLAGNLQGVPKAAFVTKYASAGALVWSKTFTGGANAAVYGVAAAPAGAVALTGFFGGTIDFGAGPLTSIGGQDGFVALLPP